MTVDWNAALSLAIGLGFLALVANVIRIRLHDGSVAVWLYAGAGLFALRAGERIGEEVFGFTATVFGYALDLGILALLVVLNVGLHRASMTLIRTHKRMERSAREYEWARDYYEQLARHRLANPLSTILGGIQTLHDLELDRDAQCEILRHMMGHAEEIRSVSLSPEPRDQVERDYYDKYERTDRPERQRRD